MRDLLFIKTSSLGDVIHQMPALTEARRWRPELDVAWMVEENFAPLVALHPAAAEAIPVAARSWRRAPWQASSWGAAGAFLRKLRARSYDAVIDTQGLVKSAVLARDARAARGGCAGLDWPSSR